MPSSRNIGVTVSVDGDSWNSQGNYVERFLDNASYTSAHPHNTLILAGPARYASVAAGGRSIADDLLPLGMVQNANVAQRRPLNPMMMIGSSRTFFLAGKGGVQFSINRLFVHGRNLLRALYTNAVRSQVLSGGAFNIEDFHEGPVKSSSDEQFFVNLDSELFYIPIGLAFLFRSVAQDPIAGFYIELAMLSGYNTQIAAGRPAIMESVQGQGDRLIPIAPNTLTGLAGAPSSSLIDQEVLEYGSDVIPNLGSR